MEINLSKVIAIKCYKKREYIWYNIYKKGTYWWKFLGIIPIFKYTQTEDLYDKSFGLSDQYLTKEKFINSFDKQFWEEYYIDDDGSIYEKPALAIWLVGDGNVEAYNCASIVKHFETVDAMLDYKNNFIKDCQFKGIYFKEL